MAEGDAELQDLYRDVLVDYFRSGAHKGELPPPCDHAHGVNPVCGDSIELTLSREGDRIGAIRFKGHGCVISQASAAMMCEAVEGRPLDEVRGLAKSFKSVMLDGAPIDSLPEALEEVRALDGVRKFPMRVKCALLGWNTLLEKLGAPPSSAGPAEGSPARILRLIGEALSPLKDPEMGVGLVALGLVYGARLTPMDGGGWKAEVDMTLTTPACPYAPRMLADAREAVARAPGIREARVEMVFEPLWDPRTMADDEAKDQLGIF